MSKRYSFEEDQERYFNGRGPQQPIQSQHYDSPRAERSPPPALSPAAHPESAFNRLRQQRRYSQERQPAQTYEPQAYEQVPAPPPHREVEGRQWAQELGYTDSAFSHTTPGADNFGEQASGGIAGIAYGVADANARESGVEAMRNTPGYDPRMENTHYNPYEQQQQSPSRRPVGPDTYDQRSPTRRPVPAPQGSHSSLTPLGAAAFPPGLATPSRSTASPRSFNDQPYGDQPFRYSRNVDPSLDAFDPNMIVEDDDEGLEYNQQRGSHRGSLLSLGHSDRLAAPAAATGGVLGGIGAFVGRKVSGQPGQQYDPVHGPNTYNLGDEGEKSEWLSKQKSGKNKMRWIIGIVVAIIIAGAIAGGVVGGIMSNKNKSSTNTPSGDSAAQDTQNNGDLDKNSAEIKALLNNKNLHKVFPGIDYTPMYTQYPDCLSYPASQNNITRDLAVLSQLTNTVRLYGTDCNQTEMLLHSIDRLGLKGKVKVWMGVWLDKNETTNARQVSQMYDIFTKYGASDFVGIIVGNEVLFRKDMTAAQLGTVISGVISNLTTMGISLPVASSDLGDDWTSALASEVDYVMANIHPFFAGVDASSAAAWTYNFWQSHDVILKADPSKHIISETGWPSTGGTNCGGAATCTSGSVASIPEMNTFMNSWVCQALANGTNYFWFEAFDEPWKIKFDEPGKQWEDKWGLMDVNRNLKPGVVIPSCGGKTVS